MSEVYFVEKQEVIFDEILKISFKVVDSNNEIVVRLGKPQKDPVFCFYCPYQIISIYDCIKHHSAGIDELLALQHAIFMLNIDLKHLAKTKSLILQRTGHVDGDLGFGFWRMRE